jgi:hypothetical protein
MSVISLGQPISVAKSILDADRTSRQKIEVANLAVYEAIRSLVADYKNPMAANLFNADWETLEAIANTSKSKILPLLQTGIPIFLLRLDTPEIREVLSGAQVDTNSLLTHMLRTFESSVPLSTL